jgi:uncharacterized membrane protein YfcA
MEINLLFFFTVIPAIILYGIAKSGLGWIYDFDFYSTNDDSYAFKSSTRNYLPILIFSDFIATYKYRKEFDLVTLKLMIPFAAIGIIIGSLTFSFFSEELLKFIIGLMGFIFAGHYFFFKKNKEAISQKNFLKGGICSTIAGFTSFCVHAGGTPVSIYMLPLRMKKEIYVGTRIIFFTFVNLIKLPLYINLSMTSFETFKQSAMLFPVAFFGILIGYKLIKIIEEKLFYNILYILIFISSSKLLYDYLI